MSGIDLGARAASALRWAASATLASQVATWAITIIVIRILTPEDYGLMAMAMLLVGLLMLMNELGLGAVLVQTPRLDAGVQARVFGVTLIVNFAFFLVAALGAPVLAAFFAEPRLTIVLQVLSLQFLIYAFEIVPLAQLERELDFKRKSLVYLVANVVGSIVTLASALGGLGVWALVAGNLTIAVVRTAGINIVAPFRRLPKFDFGEIADLLRFGALVTLERGLWFVYSQADLFVVGKALGKTVLGYYTVANDLATIVMQKTAGILYEVSFPTFAKAQHERERAAAFFVKGVRLTSFVCFPLCFGISSVAPEAIELLFGEKWLPAMPLLMMLALVIPLRMVGNLFPPALQGMGQPARSVGNLVLATLIMPAAFLAGSRWGAVGVAAAWIVAFPFVFLAMAHRSRTIIGFRMPQLLKALAGPALASVLMYGAVAAAREYVLADQGVIVRLPSLIAVGGVFYGALTLTALRGGLREFLELARR